jgi:hypothetical protein
MQPLRERIGTKCSKTGLREQLGELIMKRTVMASLLANLSFGGGAVAQTATVIVPGEAQTYLLDQSSPSDVYQGDIAVGTRLPDTVEIQTFPDQPDYGYVVQTTKG